MTGCPALPMDTEDGIRSSIALPGLQRILVNTGLTIRFSFWSPEHNSHTKENWFYLTVWSFRGNSGFKLEIYIPLPRKSNLPSTATTDVLLLPPDAAQPFQPRSSNLLWEAPHTLLHLLPLATTQGTLMDRHQGTAACQKKGKSRGHKKLSQTSNNWIDSRVLTSDQQQLVDCEHF